MGQLHDGLLGAFDVIHNNALHPFPVEHALTLPCPLVTTLHTPQLPWAERVLGSGERPDGDFVAVSRATARLWHPLISPQVVRNGVDTSSLATRPRRHGRSLVRADRAGEGAAPGDRPRGRRRTAN